MNQTCYFEPFLPLLSFSGRFDPFYSGLGFKGDPLDFGNDLAGSELSAIPPTDNPVDDASTDEDSSLRPGERLAPATEDRDLDKGVFVLVLHDGTTHAATDYWVADGYLEYINPDATRSHIPLEALDLEDTVTRNAPRGLPFVLSSEPAQNY